MVLAMPDTSCGVSWLLVSTPSVRTMMRPATGSLRELLRRLCYRVIQGCRSPRMDRGEGGSDAVELTRERLNGPNDLVEDKECGFVSPLIHRRQQKMANLACPLQLPTDVHAAAAVKKQPDADGTHVISKVQNLVGTSPSSVTSKSVSDQVAYRTTIPIANDHRDSYALGAGPENGLLGIQGGIRPAQGDQRRRNAKRAERAGGFESHTKSIDQTPIFR